MTEGLNMTLPDFLTSHPHKEIRLTGHRIGLEDVIFYYQRGESAEMLHARYPSLELSDIVKVLGFYSTNQAEVDAYCQEAWTEIARQRASARKGPTLEELRERMASKGLARGA
jgi:uncharacterized protein (DUF433 family)